MIDTRALVDRLRTLESVAIIPRVTSTNLVARRVIKECIDNDRSLPQAIIVAREQLAGRGRNARTWSSPAGKGIYATALLTGPASELPLLPLRIATVVASFLVEVFAIDARVKWPNDIYAGGRKIAGILIEARIQEDRAYLAIGVGVNVEPATDDSRPNAVSIRELSPRDFVIDDAITSFIEHLDERLSRPVDRDAIIAEWRNLTLHQPGERITCVSGDRTVSGTWAGIDDFGRALLRRGEETQAISAGDIIVEPPAEETGGE
jgi:BirA family transcriptional regulator, biotin operon repressor / biotin---[acetyl-CoA-carboxylase] ligase